MRKMVKRSLSLIAACMILMGLFTISAQAASPYDSFVVDRDSTFRRSPDLYEPSHVVNYDISGVTDIFINENDEIFIARTKENISEILVFDQNQNFVSAFGSDTLVHATGVFVDEEGYVYASDYAQEKVVVFRPDKTALREILRPESALYGTNAPFKPMKLVADKQKNIYILSEGTTNGIVQMSFEGEFQGYFGVNFTKANFVKELQRKFFSEEMLNNFIKSAPPSMNNICIDGDGMIYTTTKGDTDEPVKKINIAGKNLIPGSLVGIYDEDSAALESVAVDKNGNIFALSGLTGQIIIMNGQGVPVGIFGKKNEFGGEALGVTVNPIAVAVNSKQEVFIADKATGQLLLYTPTTLMRKMFEALALYKDGRYVEGQGLWEEVLMYNASVAIANEALGLSYFKQNDYPRALAYFTLSNSKKHYSEALWEIRQNFLLTYTQYAIVILFALILLSAVKNLLKSKTTVFAGVEQAKVRIRQSYPCRQLKAVLWCVKHPRDVFYEIKRNNSVSITTALILLGVVLLFALLSPYFVGYVFSTINPVFYSIGQAFILYTVVFGLFVGSNYLVASIREGEGKLLQVFKGTAVSFTPIALMYIPILAISNVLTLQESFIYQFLVFVMFGWSAVLLFCMVIEIHDYTVKQAVINIALTILTMVVITVVLIVIYILAKEAVGFFRLIFEEVANRV